MGKDSKTKCHPTKKQDPRLGKEGTEERIIGFQSTMNGGMVGISHSGCDREICEGLTKV